MLNIEEILAALSMLKSKDEELILLGSSILSNNLNCETIKEYYKGASYSIPHYDTYIRLLLWNNYNIKILYDPKTKTYNAI